MKLVIGLLAHVDAGKTTLSEYLLYISGALRKQGRVDHRDTFLDTHSLERERGITIFSKQARMTYNDVEFVLIDTPGHIDFSAEMERTLSILDAAILLISASDGVNPYTKTLYELLEKMSIPTYIFVNKMDLGNIAREDFVKVLQEKLSPGIYPFDNGIDVVAEDISLFDERIMESYLETGEIYREQIKFLISNRLIIPCYFGSALKGVGIQKLIDDIAMYGDSIADSNELAARVYKISYDEKEQRITFLRLMGGSLKARDIITYKDGETEKINQIRIYSGNKYSPVEIAEAGDVIGITGLEHTRAGMAIGALDELFPESLTSVIAYRIIPENCDIHKLYNTLQLLCEEDPALKVKSADAGNEVYVCLMGDVQMQVLLSILKDRFGIEAKFDLGEVVYQETIAEPVVGIGHYEPLRHYAEVHLLIEPQPAGSGIVYSSVCNTDVLALPYQKQILNALEADVPIGVLTGAQLTDVSVKLIAGRAHEKHTEGGDLRQAALRALRQGLMRATNILLEPYEEFTVKLPGNYIGRLMTDLKRLYASYGEPELEDGLTVLKGMGPVSTLTTYKKELYAYTGGEGSWDGKVCGFYKCHDAEDVVARKGYLPEFDLQHSPDSVFCAHGAGFAVNWMEVPNYAHIPADSYRQLLGVTSSKPVKTTLVRRERKQSTDEELEEIFLRTFGKSKRERYPYKAPKVIESKQSAPAIKDYSPRTKKPKDNITIIDGYNVIFDWKELNILAQSNMDSARDALLDRVVNYQGFTNKNIMVVFDAYRTPNPNSMELMVGKVKVIYTAKNETADLYIQKYAERESERMNMLVVTSDGLEQTSVLSQGAIRMSSREFLLEVENIEKQIRDTIGG